MTTRLDIAPTDLVGRPDEVEGAIAEFGRVLGDLHEAHEELASRAARMEQELEAKVAELEAILNDLPTGVVVRDAGGVVCSTNPMAQELLGGAGDSLVGHQDLPLLDGLVADGTPQVLSVDGKEQRTVTLRRSPVTLPDGSIAGSVEILDDRTELEGMNQRMAQQAKMAALGTMAGGIAHEIRNPLNAVRGFASLLAQRVAQGTTESRWAHLIEEGADECDAIVGSVLAFAAPERLCLEQLDARTLCESAVGVVRRELSRTARENSYELSLKAPAGLTFEGDRIQLRQALRNLLSNAVEVQPEGGAAQLEVRQLGGEIEFRVHDTGPGVPAGLAARVAEPFFTTRPEGTGLGLALVHTVARLHGGSLKVQSTPGPDGGADIRFMFPVEGLVPSPSATATPDTSDAR